MAQHRAKLMSLTNSEADSKEDCYYLLRNTSFAEEIAKEMRKQKSQNSLTFPYDIQGTFWRSSCTYQIYDQRISDN